jgi:7-keto-8-aminopelargonate synthetase-like enzyme
MSPRTGDAANQMTHSLKIEAALHFSVDYLANEGRLALFPGSGATP